MTKLMCSFDECNRECVAKGLCRAHYQQQWKGLPLVPLGEKGTRKNFPAATSREEFFWLRVRKSEGCWDWIGSQNGVGYGAMEFQETTVGAHRYSYELNIGPIAAGEVIDHLCHNPLCVRPSHLRVASHTQNMQNRLGAHSNSKSGVRGVYWERKTGKWRVGVTANGKKYTIGRFSTIEDAEVAAKDARLKLHS